jgi:hypothetical protein
MESNKRNLVSKVQLLTLYTNCKFMRNIVQPQDFSFSFQIFMLEVRARGNDRKENNPRGSCVGLLPKIANTAYAISTYQFLNTNSAFAREINVLSIFHDLLRN